MAPKSSSFRIGKVRAFLRGNVWYLAFYEQGIRRQPRVGPSRDAARQMAAEVNGQLEAHLPSALGFQPIAIESLIANWLDHHETVKRSSLSTICRYRTATQHLITFAESQPGLKKASDLKSHQALEFVRYLRQKKVAPNGHKNSRRRGLRDAGIKFILETCCSLFNFAIRHRHLPPYTENPCRTIEVSRLPVEDSKPIIPFTAEEEVKLLSNCDEWQFPIFLTLLMTGMRPGELVHLLLPEDLDLTNGWLHVRNKPQLGWQIKTRNERSIPLHPLLVQVLQQCIRDRQYGPVFRQRRCWAEYSPPLRVHSSKALELELVKRLLTKERELQESLSRDQKSEVAYTVWRDIGALKEDQVRTQFIRLTRSIGQPDVTAPKTLRHTFATILQESNVDPLVRNELMGHSPFSTSMAGPGLGMTAVYTHTRPETKKKFLEQAFECRPLLDCIRAKLKT